MANEKPVIPAHLQKSIDQLCDENGIEDLAKIEVLLPFKPGDGLLGQLYEINIFGTNRHGHGMSLHVFAKLAPTLELYRNFFPIRNCFEREVYTYETLLPEFIKMQKELNITNIFAPFATCYQTTLDTLQESIILQNMAKLGYKSVDRHCPVDYPHAAFVMKGLAKFHALSFAMRDKKPDLFKTLADNTRESFFKGRLTDHFIGFTQKLGLEVLARLNKHGVAYEKFQQFIKDPSFVIDKVIKPESAGEYKVLCYGDSQIRNYLFKYGDEFDPDTPTDFCMLDWQLVRCASPCLDLIFFIWICTDKKLRDQHYQELIKMYYDTFSTFLRELGSDPNKWYPVDVFEDHLKRLSVFGLFVAPWSVLINMPTSDSDQAANPDDACNSSDLANMLSTITTNMDYFGRMDDIINDFFSYGYDYSM